MKISRRHLGGQAVCLSDNEAINLKCLINVKPSVLDKMLESLRVFVHKRLRASGMAEASFYVVKICLTKPLEAQSCFIHFNEPQRSNKFKL